MNYQLTKCRMQYEKKKISKLFFINTMYSHFWSKLFQISNYIDQTNIKSIKIIKNSIYVLLKNNIEKISHINKQTKSINFLFVHETKIISFLKDLKKYNTKQ
jgi:hypothetical protein